MASNPNTASPGAGRSGAALPLPTSDRLEELGIVGAGGGGFPASAKFKTRVPLVIVNAAECEPLLHKDKELLLHHGDAMFRGLQIAMQRVGATEGVVGIKEKYAEIIDLIADRTPPAVRVKALPDVYPAGDEFILVHEVTGRVIPPGGLPKDVGAVVSNVETLVNIGIDRPVTHKYLTVAGAVHTPVTLRVPIGMAIGEVIAAAGGANVDHFGVLVGGVMMARLAKGLEEPVTKTTGGIVVLPFSHRLIQQRVASWSHVQRTGRSACDQCRFCTDLCPRNLLGHPIQPHRAMQALGFASSTEPMIAGTLYCSECNLCSLYSCPEQLDPKNVCTQAKPIARERGLVFTGSPSDIQPHPLAAFRRVPTHRLMARLGLTGFKNVGPLDNRTISPLRVTIPLRQSAGTAADPVVRVGDRVRIGDLLAAPPVGQLGARIHASIDGVVREITSAVVVQAYDAKH
ncbi:MAG TPA: 4Fe-4S dicluster domain-containing protein [Clostridia bacterium]|nr:4Fe-4S dicluster domain-containing protein [Clostridia bacterium]